jgi:hypothetical protein
MKRALTRVSIDTSGWLKLIEHIKPSWSFLSVVVVTALTSDCSITTITGDAHSPCGTHYAAIREDYPSSCITTSVRVTSRVGNLVTSAPDKPRSLCG